jgi:hypothetical protein
MAGCDSACLARGIGQPGHAASAERQSQRFILQLLLFRWTLPMCNAYSRFLDAGILPDGFDSRAFRTGFTVHMFGIPPAVPGNF